MKIFISHAEEDSEIAERLCNDLKNAGANPWSEKDILPGENWKAAISYEIRKSEYFIVLLSSKSLSARGLIQREMKMALDILDEFPGDKIFVIPVRVDDCELMEEKLLRLKTADLFPSYKNGLAQILKTLKLDANLPKTENLCIPDSYTRHLSDCCKYMDIDKLREKGRVIQVNLPEIFIPLYTDFSARQGIFKAVEDVSGLLGYGEKEFDIEDLISEHDYLLIEGEAGSGKTTLLKHFAYMTLCEKNWKNLDGFLPVLIFLKDVRDSDFGNIPAGKPLADRIFRIQGGSSGHLLRQ